jgi:4'-phosphopantetheinyl transferase EntD
VSSPPDLTDATPTADAVSLPRLVQDSFRRNLGCSGALAIGFDEPRDRTANLFDDERALAASLSGSRRDAFTTGRWLTQQLQQQVVGRASAVSRGADRAPVWPAGCLGSITHTQTLVAAAVIEESTASAIGIDLEQRKRVGEHLFPRVLTPAERDRMTALADDARRNCATLIFSAKESVYKALNPILKRYIGFQEVEVMLDAGAFAALNAPVLSGSFSIRSTTPQGLGMDLRDLRGCFWQDPDHVFTIVMLS